MIARLAGDSDVLTALHQARAAARARVRPGPTILIRTDAAGCTHQVVEWLTRQRLSYSLGFTLPFPTAELLEKIPDQVWAPALDADEEIRDGAWVAELTGLLDLTGRPAGRRVIARTPARSCDSPMPTGTGSPRLPPTPPAADYSP